MVVGVLGLQGSFDKHQLILSKLGVENINIRYSNELDICDGLIIPGGESTTMTKELETSDLRESITEFSRTKPIFGTCAGMIMMAAKIDDNRVDPLRIIDMTVDRNDWGRQIFSFTDNVELSFDQGNLFPATFIRAPKVKTFNNDVQSLCEYQDQTVLLTNGKHLACSFHPELGEDTRIHEYYIKLING